MPKKPAHILVIAALAILPFTGFTQQVPAPAGWKYLDGDEFNGQLSPGHWKLYGDEVPGSATYGQGKQQMVQTYRPGQVSFVTLAGGETVCRIHSIRGQGAPAPKAPVADKPGWWSGALSSRDAGKYYPLFCRMEIRAKVANVAGVWHAFWNRYFKGSNIAELDLQEFFVEKQGLNTVTQTVHLFNDSTKATGRNLPYGENRHFPVADPANTFHVYGVQVEPDPSAEDQAIITMMLDGKVTWSFSTKKYPAHNNFIKITKSGDVTKVWDMAITGQVGGNWVGYPAESVTEVTTDIDWFRVYVRK